MIAGLIRQAMGGALLRARMEARKAAFAAAAGFLLMGALTLAGAAGVIVLASRYGIVAALLGGAGLLVALALVTFLIGRRVPGAEASRRAVQAEAVLEDVPAPGLPHPGEGRPVSGLAALSQVHDDVRARLDGVLPPGGQGALATAAATQLARRPAATLGAAVAAGAVLGLARARRAKAEAAVAATGAPRTPETAPPAAAKAPVPMSEPSGRAKPETTGPPPPKPAARRRPILRGRGEAPAAPKARVRAHDA